jgi:phage gp36-like protein
MSENSHDVDHLIVDSVEQVRNRFGATGLRQLIDVAQSELADTESALKELTDPT